jgi:hypothetical protein
MSEASQDLSNNPFVALFSSIGEAKSLKSTVADTEAGLFYKAAGCFAMKSLPLLF